MGPPSLPPPSLSTDVGPGDLFEVSIVGEKDVPKVFRVQPDGTVDFPYLDRLTVAGLEPQQIEEMLKRELKERKILASPQVTVVVRQYNSKKINIVGAVVKPGSLPWSDGMKLVEAISLAGGLGSLADGDHVRITRIVGPEPDGQRDGQHRRHHRRKTQRRPAAGRRHHQGRSARLLTRRLRGGRSADGLK